MKMHQFFIIYKDYKGRRFHRDLRNIVELQPLAFIGRRSLKGYRLRHNLIQHAGGNARVWFSLTISIIS